MKSLRRKIEAHKRVIAAVIAAVLVLVMVLGAGIPLLMR